MSHVTEIVLFRLVEGTDEAQFLQAAQATFDLLHGYPGYIQRELSVSEDGLWTDVVLWTDMDSALTAADKIMSDAVGQAFAQLIDPSTMQMHHVQPRITMTETA